MAIQAKRKSKGDRTSQGRRATNDELERTAVTPALFLKARRVRNSSTPKNREPPTSGSPPTAMIKP